MANEVQANGWTAVPVSGKQIIEARGPISPPDPVKVEDVHFPLEDPIIVEAQSFVKRQLSPEAYNHSMRVYYWGQVIAKQLFPEYAAVLSPSTWALTCMLHDIGTAEAYFKSTRMSFDIYGGFLALETLKSLGSAHDQAEAVAEAIVRHQDMGVDGTITVMGQLIQLATLYDNAGTYEGVDNFGDLVHEDTRHSVNTAFPRLGWCSWFAERVRGEVRNKPWCHTTHIPQFDKMMEENMLHRRWE